MKTIALLSLLAEPPQPGPLLRSFRNEPVIAWTLRRLSRVAAIDRVIVLAWDDQVSAIESLAAVARTCGPRTATTRIDALAAAQRWCDGWRGGLLQSAPFDIGFSAGAVRIAMADQQADAVVLVDASAGLVDPQIIEQLIAAAAGTRDFYFTAAAPGLGGVLLKKALVDRLAHDNSHAGRLLHYLPESPVLDPLTSDACVAVPLSVCRTTQRFTLDGQSQVDRLERATQPLNGTLFGSAAETLVRRAESVRGDRDFPREITLELTTRRESKPTFLPVGRQSIDRSDLSPQQFVRVIDQIAGRDDVRLTLAGAGDPLCHSDLLTFLPLLRNVHAVHIETDLLSASDEVLHAIVANRVDVISVNLPAASPATYAKIMGVDAMAAVLDNVRRLLITRQHNGSGLPIIAPRFVKLADNFAEMEHWHDTWLRALGSAVIAGPSAFGGCVPELGVADMTPPLRRPCSRIAQRQTILSDGRIVTCEEDVLGRQSMGHIDHDSIAGVWQQQFGALREQHQTLTNLPVLCGNCKEWHRP